MSLDCNCHPQLCTHQDFAECKNCGHSDDVTLANVQGNWFCSDECWIEWSEFNS
jgi:hypothetical protein